MMNESMDNFIINTIIIHDRMALCEDILDHFTDIHRMKMFYRKILRESS